MQPHEPTPTDPGPLEAGEGPAGHGHGARAALDATALADVRLLAAGLLDEDVVLGEPVGVPPRRAARTEGPTRSTGVVVLPAERDAALASGRVLLTDLEGTPVAVLEEVTGDDGRPEAVRGRLRPLVTPGPRSAPLAGTAGPTLLVVVRRPLLTDDLERIGEVADGRRVVLVVPDGSATPDGVPAGALADLCAEPDLAGVEVVALPLAWRGAAADVDLVRTVTGALGAPDVLVVAAASDTAGSWEDVGPGWHETRTQGWTQVLAALRRGDEQLPAGLGPRAEALLRVRWPVRSRRGLVVLLTGYSGSGKSTIARGLHDRLTRTGARTASLLDGDVVRRLLSSGLGFDAASRDLNVRRIGFVAAEVARHGGIAVCAPIAPYRRSRAAVREMVEEVGDLLLVHVSTPLEVCEERDVKGLYARARTGEIPAFTGVSDPYEAPDDADVVVDTSLTPLADVLDLLVRVLVDGGWLPPGAVGPARA